MKIPLFNIKQNYQEQRKDIKKILAKILEEGNFILGRNVVSFEREFAKYLGVKYAVGVASGTDALILTLRALELKGNDEVIIPANSYPTAFAIAAVARPTIVDIDPWTLNIDPKKIERAITSRTRAIVAVHLYGRAVQMQPILGIAKKHKLFCVEDAAQAHGAIYQGKKVGALADIGCFSFYPTKNLGCFGDGGMVVTNNKKIAETVRALRMYGEKRRYHSFRLGTVSRLDELQAGLLRLRLKKLDAHNWLRIGVAQQYFSLLKQTGLVLPPLKTDGSCVYHLFPILSKKRGTLKNILKRHGVETVIHSPLPVHLVKAFSFLGYKRGDFPQAERVAKEILALPCYPQLKHKQIITICNLIKDFLK